MNFHYNEHHSKLTIDCPPKDYVPLNITAFRWVFAQNDEKNFQSQYEKDMKRKKPPKRYNDMTDLEKCERMALSMFISLELAENQFFFLRDEQNLQENAYLWLGENLAVGEISVFDGVNEIHPNKFGHFNHHPASGFDYHHTFQIISCFCKL